MKRRTLNAVIVLGCLLTFMFLVGACGGDDEEQQQLDTDHRHVDYADYHGGCCANDSRCDGGHFGHDHIDGRGPSGGRYDVPICDRRRTVQYGKRVRRASIRRLFAAERR